MDTINLYLQELVSKSGNTLHLEPNRNPYVVTASGNSDLTNEPLQGSQINMMIFTLIPSEVKQQLPGSSEVEFTHPHNLGNFNFHVRKSPAGFFVTISPAEEPTRTEEELPEGQTKIVDPLEGLEFNSAVPTGLTENDIHGITYTDLGTTELDAAGIEISSGFELPEAAPRVAPESPEAVFESPSADTLEYTAAIVEPEPEPVVRAEPEAVQEDVLPEIPVQHEVIESYPSALRQESAAEPEVQFQGSPAGEVHPDSQKVPQFEQSVVPEQTYQPQERSAAHTEEPFVPLPYDAEAERFAAIEASANPEARAKMEELFSEMAAIGSSDLHMSVSVPPMVRKDGKMIPLEEGRPALTAESIRELLSSIMPPKNREEFARRNDTDFAYEIPELARFRANIFMDRKGMGGVFRIIPSDMMTAEDLGLSKHILDLCDLSKGLVVVTGPTGSGKSTTLCAMINYINERREDHIITIEDPIEFTHENKKCLVNQREVHNHTDSFKDALRAALREDPDILLVGEMRDLETISIAIETAETGHLVFGTLHTTTAASTVDRIIDQFPADRQQQIRVMLSESLRGVIAQTLLPKKGGGRVAALEVLIVTPAISNLIREGKTFQIPSAMQTGKNIGMAMLNDSLIELVRQGIVEPRDAYIKAVDKTGFELLLQRTGMKM